MKAPVILVILGTAAGFAAGYWFRGERSEGESAAEAEGRLIGRAPAAMRAVGEEGKAVAGEDADAAAESASERNGGGGLPRRPRPG